MSAVSQTDAKLFELVASNDLESLRTHLAEGADPNQVSREGEPLIHWLARYGSREAGEMLIRYGADLGVRDADGRSVEEVARGSGNIAVGELLRDHSTLLECAWALESHDIGRMARALAGNPGALRRMSAFSGDLLAAAIQVITTPAIDAEVKGEDVEEFIARERGFFDLLLQHGAPVDGPAVAQLPPLHTAVQLPVPVLADELLKRGASPERLHDTVTPRDCAGPRMRRWLRNRSNQGCR